MVRFYAAKSVAVSISPAPVPIQKYLSDSERLVYSLIDPSQVSKVGRDRFQFNMRSIRFMMINLEPIAIVKVMSNDDGDVVIYSDTCKLRDQDFFNRHFVFELQGILTAQPDNSGVTGNAELEIKIDLPSAFRLTPRSILESTGNAILNGILATIKQRLQKQLAKNYQTWAANELATASLDS